MPNNRISGPQKLSRREREILSALHKIGGRIDSEAELCRLIGMAKNNFPRYGQRLTQNKLIRISDKRTQKEVLLTSKGKRLVINNFDDPIQFKTHVTDGIVRKPRRPTKTSRSSGISSVSLFLHFYHMNPFVRDIGNLMDILDQGNVYIPNKPTYIADVGMIKGTGFSNEDQHETDISKRIIYLAWYFDREWKPQEGQYYERIVEGLTYVYSEFLNCRVKSDIRYKHTSGKYESKPSAMKSQFPKSKGQLSDRSKKFDWKDYSPHNRKIIRQFPERKVHLDTLIKQLDERDPVDPNMKEWMTQLFKDKPDNERIEIRVLQGKSVRKYFFKSPDELAYHTHLPDKNIFYTVSGRYIEAGTKKTVSSTCAIVMDFDDCDMTVAKSRILSTGLPMPSAWVFTGHGYHCYWFLSPPYRVRRSKNDTAKDIAFFESITKSMAKALGADPSGAVLGHMFRVPKTYNVKDQDNPIRSEIIEFEPNRRYTMEHFSSLITREDIMTQQAPAKDKLKKADIDIDSGRKEFIEKWEIVFDEAVKNKCAPNIEDLPDWIKKAIIEGAAGSWVKPSPGKDRDRSKTDYALITELLKQKWMIKSIIELYTCETYKVSEKYIEKGPHGKSYLLGTIYKCKTVIERSSH